VIWQNLRLSYGIHADLQRYAARLTVCRDRDPKRFPTDMQTGPISLGTAIGYLLSQQRRHYTRAAAAKLARARRNG
jgi:hypothetical protein